MNSWLRKLLIVLVSILTFGAVTPSHAMWSENQDLQESRHPNQRSDTTESPSPSVVLEQDEAIPSSENIIEQLVDEAENQSFKKFGPKISNVIEEEFREVILPNIEATITMTAAQYPEDELTNLAITENPGNGTSEKIFNIFDTKTNQDIILFHVRREKPPLEGYQFNFHYHTYHDQFETHYTIGTIYWSKDTPPKWQSV